MIEKLELLSKINTTQSEQVFEDFYLSHGYRPLWSIFSIHLKVLVDSEKTSKVRYFYKPLILFIPKWYVILKIDKVTDNNTKINICYYTKGLSFLDIFGAGKEWAKEFEETKKRFS